MKHIIKYYIYSKDSKELRLYALRPNSKSGKKYDCSIAVRNDENSQPMYAFRIYLKK